MYRLAARLTASSLALFAVLVAMELKAGPPQINQVTPRGLRIGGVTTLIVEGTDLLPAARLLVSGLDVQATISADSTPQRVQFQVTVPDSVVPGIVGLRVASAQGVSNLVAVGVDRLEQTPFSSPVTALPVALHGQIGGDQRVRAKFRGAPGQRIVADIESQRLGAALRPVLRLYDARDVQLAWSGPRADLAGDARLEFTLPADGEYVIEVHDVLFRAAAPGFFRLKIGDLRTVAHPFPAGVTRGATTTVEWLGGGYPAGTQTQTVANVSEGARHLLLAPPPSGSYTGHATVVAVSDFPETTESRTDNSTMMLGKAPTGVSGRLALAKEEDRYELSVMPGNQLRIECFAQRIGSPIDGVLSVLGPQGSGLANSDDRPGTSDPGLDFTVPAGVDRIILAVRDLQQRGGPDFTYRLTITDLTRPDVTAAVVDVDRVQIPAGSTQLLPVRVTRQSYNGPLTLAFENLPAGVQAAGLQIAPDATVGLISLTAATTTPDSALASLGRLVIRGGDGPTAFAQWAQSPDSPLVRLRPWERADVAVGVAPAGPLTAAWGEFPADEKLPLGGKLPMKLSVTRASGVTGSIRLRLTTSQVIPKKTVKQNNMDVQVDDTDRALRFEGEPTIAADANDTTVPLIVPADLSPGPWSFAIVAELLGADNKTVAATAATPVRVLSAVKN